MLPQAANLAGAAKLLGFAGVAFDEELYKGKSGTNGTWDWNFAGNTHTEAAVRAQAKARGAQLMNALVGAYPGLDIVDIHPLMPEGWGELVQQEINGVANAYQSMVDINFWDGMTSVPGYGPIRFMDHDYNKGSGLNKSTWDTAFTYDLNRISAMFSRRLSNWAYASSRIDWGPFAWINAGPRPWEAARPPSQVAAQLAAFRKWGTGGAFANYAYGGINSSFDYTPYVPGLQAAATPGIVDTQPPAATVGVVSRSGATVTLSGSATDNFAVRAVRWRTATGASGAATMTLDRAQRDLRDRVPVAYGLVGQRARGVGPAGDAHVRRRQRPAEHEDRHRALSRAPVLPAQRKVVRTIAGTALHPLGIG